MEYLQESMVNVAYDIIGSIDHSIEFKELWEQVAERKNFTEEEKEDNQSLFYTNLILDGRMITVGENRWDLRSRHKFEEVHIDMNDIYAEEEEESDEEEDDATIEDSYNDD